MNSATSGADGIRFRRDGKGEHVVTEARRRTHSWIFRGYTPAAVECWNAIRGIDNLTARPEVDAGRIAATGLSLGGR